MEHANATSVLDLSFFVLPLGPFTLIALERPYKGLDEDAVGAGTEMRSGGLYKALTGSHASGVTRFGIASFTKVATGTMEKEYSGLSISLYPPRSRFAA